MARLTKDELKAERLRVMTCAKVRTETVFACGGPSQVKVTNHGGAVSVMVEDLTLAGPVPRAGSEVKLPKGVDPEDVVLALWESETQRSLEASK